MRIARSFRRGRGPGPKRNVLFPAPNETPRSNGISPPPKKEKKHKEKRNTTPGLNGITLPIQGIPPNKASPRVEWDISPIWAPHKLYTSTSYPGQHLRVGTRKENGDLRLERKTVPETKQINRLENSMKTLHAYSPNPLIPLVETEVQNLAGQILHTCSCVFLSRPVVCVLSEFSPSVLGVHRPK